MELAMCNREQLNLINKSFPIKMPRGTRYLIGQHRKSLVRQDGVENKDSGCAGQLVGQGLDRLVPLT
jgi:hypothetical protein